MVYSILTSLVATSTWWLHISKEQSWYIQISTFCYDLYMLYKLQCILNHIRPCGNIFLHKIQRLWNPYMKHFHTGYAIFHGDSMKYDICMRLHDFWHISRIFHFQTSKEGEMLNIYKKMAFNCNCIDV